MAGSNLHITNINLKCKWPKHPNQKTQTGKLDKKWRLIDVLYSEDPFHMQRHTQTQNKGMEEDLPTKWREKTNKQKTGVSILIFDKTDFKPTKIKRDKEGYLHNGKKINASRRAKDPKYIRLQYRSIQVHKASKFFFFP